MQNKNSDSLAFEIDRDTFHSSIQRRFAGAVQNAAAAAVNRQYCPFDSRSMPAVFYRRV